MRKIIALVIITCLGVLGVAERRCEAETLQRKRVSEEYPLLATGILTMAEISQLPDGIVLRSRDIVIERDALTKAISGAPAYLHEALKANAFFLLEQQASDEILKRLATESLTAEEIASASLSKESLVSSFVENLVEEVKVSESDVESFYSNNESLFHGAPLESVRESVRSFLEQEKKLEYLDEYLRMLGQSREILVSASWLRKNAEGTLDNPVDRSRSADKLTLAVFSEAGCCGPDLMIPVIREIEKSFGDNVSVVYVEPGRNPILAARFKVRSVPTLLFFDESGKETHRHSGYMDAESVSKQLKQAHAEKQ